MKNIKTLFLSVLAGIVLPAGAAQPFTSSVFTVGFTDGGRPIRLNVDKTVLSTSIILNGEYVRTPGGKTVRLYQSWDNKAKARFERTQDQCIVTVDSVLGSKEDPEIAKYRIREVWTPGKAVFEYEATLCRDLPASHSFFRVLVQMPETLFGCGVKETSLKGEENFKILPETFEKKFFLNGRKLAFCVEGKGVFTIEAGKDTTLSLMDSRVWGGKDFSIVANPAVSTPAVRGRGKDALRPAGTTWKWGFTLTFEKEK